MAKNNGCDNKGCAAGGCETRKKHLASNIICLTLYDKGYFNVGIDLGQNIIF